MNNLSNNDASWIRDLWIGSFTGICGSALMWDNMHKRELWPHFGRLRAFVAGYDFDESSNDQKGWIPFHEYDNFHNGSGVDKYGVSDLFYLRSPDKEKAIGVIANRTYNFYTQWECSKPPFNLSTSDGLDDYNEFNNLNNQNSDDNYLYASPRLSQYQDEQLYIKNLKGYPSKRYVIEYYNAWDPAVVIKTEIKRNDNWNGLKLEFPATTGTSARPIVLVKVNPFKNKSLESNGSPGNDTLFYNYFEDSKIESETEFENSKPKVYPNPFNSILNIRLPGSETNSIIIVNDLSGRTLMHLQSTENITDIDLSSLEPGTYMLTVLLDGNLSHIKIIKQ